MLEADKLFAGSIPENYDRYMVPLIFEPYAADMAQRAAHLSPGAVLEIAAGTGVVTRALARKLPPGARYIVTDLNQPMLDYAASRQGPDSRITWRHADAMALPFENAAFDLVCCQFGAMFFPDRSVAYRETKRVLKPGGHFLFNVWDRIEENDFADEVTNALARIFPDDPPRFMARTPHGYHDTALIRRELEQAVSPAWRSRRAPNKAVPPRRASRPLLIVRERFCAAKSKPGTRDNCKRQPTPPKPRLRTDTARARLPPRIQAARHRGCG